MNFKKLSPTNYEREDIALTILMFCLVQNHAINFDVYKSINKDY